MRGTSVSLTSLLAPKQARRSVEQATKALKKEKFGEAEGLLKSAIDIYPKTRKPGSCWAKRTQLQKRNQEARDSYWRAVQADGLYVRPYLRLARLSMSERGLAERRGSFEQGAGTRPDRFSRSLLSECAGSFNLKDWKLRKEACARGSGWISIRAISANAPDPGKYPID